jgi:predicted RecB family nuclease
MKRKSDQLFDDFKINKKIKLSDVDWVSGTVIKNYIQGEPVLDWFNMYYDRTNKKNILSEKKFDMGLNLNPFIQKGILFEREIYDDLKNKFPTETVELYNQYTDGEINKHNFEKTIKAMKKGTPIIMQAVLMNEKLKIRGVADLIVRTDYLNKIFNKNIETDFKSDRIPVKIKEKGYYYVVIDIKYSHLTLCSKRNLVRNNGRMKAYKGQLLIYNLIIGQIQKYTPSKSYLLGKSWNISSTVSPSKGFNSYDLLGVIDYENFDKKYISLTKEAIDWIRNLRKNGHNWSPLKPHIKEMCCNMSNTYDEPWGDLKKKITSDTKDLTCIWNIGTKIRDIAFDKNIKSYNQIDCTVENLGLKPSKTTDIIRDILQVNKINEKRKILPEKIKIKKDKWYKTYSNEFYIDFETFCDSSSENSLFLFMIGVGFEKDGKWIYKCFKCKNKSNYEEKRILKKFKKYIDKNKKPSKKPTRLIHWSPAEKNILEKLLDKYQKLLKLWWDDINWFDLCELFKSEPITIKGATDFKLKSIAKAMYNNKMIKTQYDSGGIDNGKNASFIAFKYYEEAKNDDIFSEIISYNETDCKVLWDILKFLRNYRK